MPVWQAQTREAQPPHQRAAAGVFPSLLISASFDSGGRAGGRGCSLAARPPILRIRPQQPLVNLRAAQVLRGPSGIQCP